MALEGPMGITHATPRLRLLWVLCVDSVTTGADQSVFNPLTMKLLVIFLAVVASVVAADVDEKDVLVLKEATFKDAIKDNEFILVEFCK